MTTVSCQDIISTWFPLPLVSFESPCSSADSSMQTAGGCLDFNISRQIRALSYGARTSSEREVYLVHNNAVHCKDAARASVNELEIPYHICISSMILHDGGWLTTRLQTVLCSDGLAKPSKEGHLLNAQIHEIPAA